MEFSPSNRIVQLCLQGMGMEEKDEAEEARRLFLQAWEESTSDFEKFLAAHYVARQQDSAREKLKWNEMALQFAKSANDEAARSAFPSLYSNIAKCYEELGDLDNAKTNYEAADSFNGKPSDRGRFIMGPRRICRLAIR